MINLYSITSENNKENNEKWPYIPNHPYKILIIGDFGSRKSKTLINLIKEQDYDYAIDKINLYAKDLNKPKYKFLIEMRKYAGIKHYDDTSAFTECSNTIDDVYENTDDYNLSGERKRKKLIVHYCRYYGQ